MSQTQDEIRFHEMRLNKLKDDQEYKQKRIEKRLGQIRAMEDRAIQLAEKFASGEQIYEGRVNRAIKMIGRVCL